MKIRDSQTASEESLFPLFFMNILDNTIDLNKEMAIRNEKILQEIRSAGYDGPVINGQDLDVF